MFKFLYVILRNLFRAPYMIPRMRYEADHPEKFTEEERYRLVRHAITLMMRSGKIETECFGQENLPKDQGYVMYPNHQGKYDALGIMISHPTPCSLVMDKAKSNTILVSEFVDLVQGKRLEKDNVRQGMQIILEVSEDVKNGMKYILFPEGGYEFNNFKAGSFKCAVRAKAPIVPVVLIDSYKVFNTFHLGSVKTQVHFLPPLYYEDYKDLKTNQIAEVVKERIEQKMNEITGSAAAQDA